MNFFFTLIAGIAFPAPPTLAGWVVWVLLLGALVYSLTSWRVYQPEWTRREWGIFTALFILIPITSLFIGLRLTSASTRPLPGLPAEATGSALMFFSAIPWILGGGLLGPIGGAVLGAFAGLLRGVWDTYSFFSILEFALMGAWFAANNRQQYRTAAYRWLRQPLIGVLLLIPLHLFFHIISSLFTQWGVDISAPVTARLDLAISNSSVIALAFSAEMLVAGVAAQILSSVVPYLWGSKLPLQPSPGEKSLRSRFIFSAGTFILLLLVTLLIGDWVVAGRAAREMLADRLASAGNFAAQSVPFFLETGQNLAVQLASEPPLLDTGGDELRAFLGSRIKTFPYFDQLLVLNADDKTLVADYPNTIDGTSPRLHPDEISGMSLASNGVLTQIYSIPTNSAVATSRVSFMAAILDSSGQVQRVLIGRTTLETNPLTLSLIESIDHMRDLGGTGLLLDENNRIIYSSEISQPLTIFKNERHSEAIFYDDTAADGTRQLVYYQPVIGHPWAVVLSVPAQQAQQIALDIAMPLSLMIIFLSLAAMISLRVGLGAVTGSLQGLAIEANRIAEGDLDHPLQLEGEDEVGQLRRAFEQMRSSLQERLKEINSLLRVSQDVASSLEMRDSVKPVLEAILNTGANSVSVILSPSILPDTFIELPSRFALGVNQDMYTHLDDQILAIAQNRGKIVLAEVSQSQELYLDPDLPQPLAMLAVALRHENRYYGVVWAGFDQPRVFPDSDVRFVTTLAGQAALAIANAHLYMNVEASRRQLEAVLNSTTDPVLVTDHRNRLLLTNHAAAVALGQNAERTSGQETEKVVKLKPLLALLQSATTEEQSTEIMLADKRTYLATASSVIVEGRQIGRVCIMRDVTHFKELDKMKSEFVATVSHDLRSPLTLISGYASMLGMVGELNEAQQGYVQKITEGVDNMSRLVKNLLDLGRIEIGIGLQVENVIVLDIIEQVTSALQLQASQKNIILSVELARDVPHALEADQALLHQAVYNLVENAIKYTPNDGRVIVRASSQPGYLIFAVEDSGIGIAVDDLPHLFEKFYRGKQREARAQHGSGLGLAIVHSVAANHGGRVWVDSVIGKGSTFYLQIPLIQPKDSKPA
ncbi:ATP-binding protein [Candidatus Villigracilis saccharophilus]|uniref:ATP-binding protein n=1 Tax=Candidatus Villigracilis saccharophilus TaxID=3140684 RepID=UPI0031364A10|nr:HAMP domain-containing protein [Anaerolineales bacterium]